MATSIDIVSLLTTILVLVHDWYISQGQALLQGKPGSKPEFSDSEVMTLMLAQDFIPYPGETQYIGYKLVMLTTLDGLPVLYDLVAANTDEREAAEVVLQRVRDCDIFGDKGFLGDDWQADIRQRTGNRVWTAKRANQARQNPAEF